MDLTTVSIFTAAPVVQEGAPSTRDGHLLTGLSVLLLLSLTHSHFPQITSNNAAHSNLMLRNTQYSFSLQV